MEHCEDQPRNLRRDAALNRERLLKAGREVFAAQGFGATLNDVAKYAGLGVGTAYRNFENKAELIDAIVVDQVKDLETILNTALGMTDAWQGLVYYMEHASALQVHDRGMAQLFTSRHAGTGRFNWSRDRLAPLVNNIAARARNQHAIRTEITGTDLILIQFGVIGIAESLRKHEGAADKSMDHSFRSATGSDDDMTQHGTASEGIQENNATIQPYRRYLWIALDGIRTSSVMSRDGLQHAVPTLPIRALHTEELHRILAQ